MKKNIFFLILIICIFAGSCNNYHAAIWDPNGAKATSLIIDKSTLSVKISQSASINATVSPVNAVNASVIWESDKEVVATVSENGRVTGVSAGSATIRALTEDRALSAECSITVEALGTVCTLSALTIEPDVVGNSANNLKFDKLQPDLSDAVMSYLYAPVKYNATKVTVSATSDANASIIINSVNPASQGSASSVVALPDVGLNKIIITVSAEDAAVTPKEYAIYVYRATPVFKTGDTTDGDYGIKWPDNRFSVNAIGEVTDAMTGLVWYKDGTGAITSDQIYNSLTVPSSSLTWRLPNIREMRSLFNHGVEKPDTWLSALWGSTFSGTVFWNGTTNLVSVLDNCKQYGAASTSYNMLRVSGTSNLPKTGYSETPSGSGSTAVGISWSDSIVFPRFRKSSTGLCVIDNMTGLMWYANTVSNGKWPSVKSDVLTFNVGSLLDSGSASISNESYTDWRMPNINELETLAHYGNVDYVKNNGINQSKNNCWSSTTRVFVSGNSQTENVAFFMTFGTYHEINLEYKDSTPLTTPGSTTTTRTVWPYYLLPVRGFSEKE
jgi:hypothetical protein